MARNFISIGKEFALTGLFSEYLPPCFSLNDKALQTPPPMECDLVKPISFTMSRYNSNDARRTLFVPEVGSYLAAHVFMQDHNIYKELIQFTETEEYSFSPILGEDRHIMRHEQSYGWLNEAPTSEYIKNISEKLVRATGAKKILKLDISNCFSSFYMHMIPAIILGADQAEVEYDKALKKKRDPDIDVDPKYELYSKLDQVIRKQNMNRTNGLLPGILSSKLIAEAVLTRIDKELAYEKIRFVRYVDDYEVFLYENNEDNIISIFTRILKKYGFSLNFEKIQIIEFPFYIVENFEKILHNRLENTIEYPELIDIFNKFFLIEKAGTKGAIRYLLKTFEKYNIRVDDPALYKSYLITLMANNPRSLTKACAILINDKDEYPIDLDDRDIIIGMLEKHLTNGNDLEVIWLLYLLIETNNMYEYDSIIDKIISSASELAVVLLLRKNLLNDERINVVTQKANSWIMLYELYQQNYIEEADFVQRLNLNKNKTMYKKFKSQNIHFVY